MTASKLVVHLAGSRVVLWVDTMDAWLAARLVEHWADTMDASTATQETMEKRVRKMKKTLWEKICTFIREIVTGGCQPTCSLG